MRKIVVALCFVFIVFSSYSQIENSVFNVIGSGTSMTFTTDYQSLGINPANLGWSREFEKKIAALGFAETGYSFTSKLNNNKLVKDIKSFPFSFSIVNTGNYNDFQTLSSDLQSGMSIRFDSRIIGFSINTRKAGGFAFSVNERYAMDGSFSKDFADIITFGYGAPYFDKLIIDNSSGITTINNSPSNFDSIKADPSTTIIGGESNNPKSVSELMNGSELKISWLREYNFGYGKQIFKKASFGLYVGFGVKYIQGLGLYDLSVTDNNISGFSSLAPKNIGVSTPNFISNGAFRVSLPEASGSGFGFDFGVNIKAFKFFKMGLSVTDIGSVTWDKNTYQIESNPNLAEFEGSGVYNGNGGSEGFDAFARNVDNLTDFKKGNYSRKVALPTTMRVGIGFQVGRILQIGMEGVTPFNSNPGSILNSTYSLGGILKLGPLKFSSGITVYDMNIEVTRIPIGVTFSPLRGTYEAGFSTRDIKSLIKPSDVETPMKSVIFGFLRFRF